jgi:phage shock protein A
MEDFTRWFLGQELYEGWKWLWGVPPSSSTTVKPNDEIILEEITRSLSEARASLIKLQSLVDRARLLTSADEDIYNRRQQAHQEFIGMSLESKRQGNIFEARSAMGQAIQLERTLPNFKERSETSQRTAIAVRDFYRQKLDAVALLESSLAAAKFQIEVNNLMEFDSSPDLVIIQENLENIQNEIEDRHHRILAEIDLANSSNCELMKTLNPEEIDERLQDLEDLP